MTAFIGRRKFITLLGGGRRHGRSRRVGKLQENVRFSGGLGAFRNMTRLQCATAMPLCKGYESTVTKTARTSISSTDGRTAISPAPNWQPISSRWTQQ